MSRILSRIEKTFFIKFDSKELKDFLISRAVEEIDDCDITENDFERFVIDDDEDFEFENVVIVFKTIVEDEE